MLGLTFSSKLDWVSKKIGALIRSLKFLSLVDALISINLPYSHAQNTVGMSRLVLLVATWNCQIYYKTVATSSLATSLDPLTHRQNVAGLCFFYRHYFGRYSSELAQLVTLPHLRGRSTCYSDRLLVILIDGFYVTIPRYYKDVLVNSFFSHTAGLWNSLSIECFPLTII